MQQEEITKATDSKDIDAYTQAVYNLISVALDVPISFIFDAPWYEVSVVYISLTNINRLREIPILNSSQKDRDKPPWEYIGRRWYWWIHVFARNYGWSIETVANLDPDDALSLLQEISIEKQLDREWQWSVNELAYPYNSTTKKSDFKPLSRPDWMSGASKENASQLMKKVKFPRNMLPVGYMIGEDGRERIASG